MIDRQRFLVRFWGVRGSYPMPGADTMRHGGNTSCVEVQAGAHTLILDAGSGIIRLGEDLLQRPHTKPLNISLLITHGHSDHLNGLPFFTPLYEPDTCIDFFGPRLDGYDIEQLVTPPMSPPYFPVDIRKLPSQRAFHTLPDDASSIIWERGAGRPEMVANDHKEAREAEIRITAKFTHNHPQNGSFIYRIEYAGRCLVFATDVEWARGCDADIIGFIQGANLLIHDAQYTPDDYRRNKDGFGHSTFEMATEVALAAGVDELVLFHHEPTYDDNTLDGIEAEARKRFARTRSACEGMEIDLLAV
ncbi:MAG: MBL fold metallo-hydrolase [Ktedonobacteraceae bacterium]|nr:MBL fold metallo-hydrolase [Chloroflexota bacterium]